MNKPLTTQQVQARFRNSGGRLMLIDFDGHLWATNSYVAVRVPEKSVIRDLLAEYNLPSEPMVCDVGRTVFRNGAEPPSLDKLITSGDYVPITRATYGGRPFLLTAPAAFTENGVVFDHPSGSQVVLNAAYVALVEELAETANGEASWLGMGDALHIVRWGVPGGDVLGLAMPIRCELSFGAAISDAA